MSARHDGGKGRHTYGMRSTRLLVVAAALVAVPAAASLAAAIADPRGTARIVLRRLTS
jgi:hypothetical protein